MNDESPRDAGSQISPPLDSLQEFKMETSDYTAQYGRLSGSVVNMVTKSGGNRLPRFALRFHPQRPVRRRAFRLQPAARAGENEATAESVRRRLLRAHHHPASL